MTAAGAGADASLLAAVAAGIPASAARIGVAVSGGSDSMALLHLAARVARDRGQSLCAATVDHRLRPEAAAEAAFVAKACAALGVPHDVMVWEHGAVPSNLMERARQARYALLGAWARGRGIGPVALGHTADDQAETVLMALARGSGLDGLAGMRAGWDQGGVGFVRPLLDVTRGALRLYLAARDVAWIDDPTNDDDRFARIRARQALVALGPLGITVTRLGEAARNLSMARRAIEAALAQAFAGIGGVQAGAVLLDRAGFMALDAALAHRLVVESLRWVSGAEHPARAEGIARVQAGIAAGRGVTLSGCRVVVRAGRAMIVREPRAVAGVVSATDAPWDGRWMLDGPHAADLSVRALGAGLRACPDWRATGLSREVLVVTPAVWRGDALVAAPLAGWAQGWGATVAAGFSLPPLSH